jgi:hypothetical protein
MGVDVTNAPRKEFEILHESQNFPVVGNQSSTFQRE